MTVADAVVPALPTARPPGRPFDPPDELVAWRDRAPLARMRYPDGHLGWLASGYHPVREVLGDRRFSSRYELMHLPFPMPGFDGPVEIPPATPGDMTGIDPPEHTRLRRLLVGYFTVRRMRALTEEVTRIADELLRDMGSGTPGRSVDLVEAYARPLPARVICELLGVPFADRASFQDWALALTDHHATPEQKGAAMNDVHAYLLELIRAARTAQADDGGVIAALADSDLSDDELAGVGALLLLAGFDTTANMIALGTFALLEHTDQLAALRADPETLADSAVEELLRWLTIGHTGARAALEDVEIDGHRIAAGETVTLAIQAANRDPRWLPDADVLDLGRSASGQLAFGHGVHQCLGQQLARVELRIALPALLTRAPGLRLAVDAADVPLRPDANLYGVHRLPVTW